MQSPCILENKISQFLSIIHNNHGHFGANVYLNYLIKRAYQPIWDKNVNIQSRLYYSCQAKMKKSIRAQIRGIQVFAPMKILGIEKVGLITSAYSINGVVYVLLVVDYFKRFIWAKDYIKHTADECIDIYENYIFLIFGHTKAIYLDNSFYFVK